MRAPTLALDMVGLARLRLSQEGVGIVAVGCKFHPAQWVAGRAMVLKLRTKPTHARWAVIALKGFHGPGRVTTSRCRHPTAHAQDAARRVLAATPIRLELLT